MLFFWFFVLREGVFVVFWFFFTVVKEELRVVVRSSSSTTQGTELWFSVCVFSQLCSNSKDLQSIIRQCFPMVSAGGSPGLGTELFR